MHTLKVVLTLVMAAVSLAAAESPAPTLPVSVSAANYANTSWDEIRQKVANPNQVNPLARTEHLTWKQGLADTVKTTSSLLGGAVAFDNRAGGNDDALGMAISEQGKIGSTTGGITESSQGGTDSSGYESTRDFYLLVVDAFDYKELVAKQQRAPRKWTTFIALPREAHNSFAAVLPTMLKVATPYFGETTSGLQVFNDARATVTLGELQVVESDVKPPPAGKK